MPNKIKLDRSGIPDELMFMLDLIKEPNIEQIEHEFSKGKQLDWELLIELMIHHRLFPILYLRLKQFDTVVPKHILQTCASLYRQNTFEMLRLTAEMESLCIRAEQLGIRVLCLKGPFLAHELYGDISKRTSVDLDILIHLSDLARIEEELLGLGYIKDDYIQSILGDWKWRHHHITFSHPQKRMKIEVHWRLNPGPSKEPSFEMLWKRRVSSTLTSSPVYLLSREDLYLFLIMHGARHGWSRLRWLDDIRHLLQLPLNETILFKLLKKYRYCEVGGQANILAYVLLQASMNETCKQFMRLPKAQRLAQQALFYVREMVHLHSPPLPEHVDRYHKRYLQNLMSWQQKCIFRLSCLHPYPEDAATLPLPKSLHVLYFGLRPFLWAWRKVEQRNVKRSVSTGGELD